MKSRTVLEQICFTNKARRIIHLKDKSYAFWLMGDTKPEDALDQMRAIGAWTGIQRMRGLPSQVRLEFKWE